MAGAQTNHQDAKAYWQSIDADVNGNARWLSLYLKVNLQVSRNFLAKLGIGGKNKTKVERAVDCDAG
jgi:protein N-terminal methyltransferase